MLKSLDRTVAGSLKAGLQRIKDLKGQSNKVEFGRGPQFADWQIGQVLDAIHWAHDELRGEDWVRDFPWDEVRDGFAALSSTRHKAAEAVSSEDLDRIAELALGEGAGSAEDGGGACCLIER